MRQTLSEVVARINPPAGAHPEAVLKASIKAAKDEARWEADARARFPKDQPELIKYHILKECLKVRDSILKGGAS